MLNITIKLETEKDAFLEWAVHPVRPFLPYQVGRVSKGSTLWGERPIASAFCPCHVAGVCSTHASEPDHLNSASEMLAYVDGYAS